MSIPRWMEALTGPLDQKKSYKADRRRLEALPSAYRAAAEAGLRYLMFTGPTSDGAVLTTMVSEYADLWERAALDGTPVRDIVGEDPVDFLETFAAAYAGRNWIDKERERLQRAIAAAEAAEPGTPGAPGGVAEAGEAGTPREPDATGGPGAARGAADDEDTP